MKLWHPKKQVRAGSTSYLHLTWVFVLDVGQRLGICWRNTFPTAYWKYTYHHGTTNCNGPGKAWKRHHYHGARPARPLVFLFLRQGGRTITSCGRPCFSIAFGTLGPFFCSSHGDVGQTFVRPQWQ